MTGTCEYDNEPWVSYNAGILLVDKWLASQGGHCSME